MCYFNLMYLFRIIGKIGKGGVIENQIRHITSVLYKEKTSHRLKLGKGGVIRKSNTADNKCII